MGGEGVMQSQAQAVNYHLGHYHKINTGSSNVYIYKTLFGPKVNLKNFLNMRGRNGR